MSVVVNEKGEIYLLQKVHRMVLSLCTNLEVSGGIRPITKRMKNILIVNEDIIGKL